ncbi:MAG TPA: glycerophosphodiester phosphodiesterase [Ruminococcaceae bacterium]|nr:glycerophosphodiester phosphodiesterase [Oscillospiraceae bacterium]
MYSCNIIAHRGANKRAPQNTLPAFLKAIELGCDGFETDVHLSKDGVPVICHNDTIDATSDGTGRISDLTLEELKSHDFGSYFSKDFAGTTLPTLDEFLDVAASGNLKILNIELKKEPDDKRRDELVTKTLEAVEKHGLSDILLISSFSVKILRLVRQKNPACKTALLYPNGYFRAVETVFPPIMLMVGLGCSASHPHKLCIRDGYVKQCHGKNLKVNVWTVDEAEEIRNMLRAGVDSIITDCPDRVRFILQEMNEAK